MGEPSGYYLWYRAQRHATERHRLSSGNISYTPAAGTVLIAGGHTLHVDFTPNDTTNYNNASADATINVLKADTLSTSCVGQQPRTCRGASGVDRHGEPSGTGNWHAHRNCDL